MAGLNIQAIQDAKDAINVDKVPHAEYMRVVMNGAVFLVAVDAVSSVARPSVVTPVPMAPDHLIGVANVKGQIFCIIDAGKVLNLAAPLQEKTSQTRFLLLRHDSVHLGLWVESIAELYSVPLSDIPVDSGGKFMMGYIKIKQEELSILRVNALFD
ncbi:MAG: chemotaxis protein CheW [Ghiorsea sp.]|nr:chemotaxis protein CheW [Ghiorsea sp.]